MNFLKKYLGLYSDQLNAFQIAFRVLVALITFILFIKISRGHHLEQKERDSLNFLVTIIAVFILTSSIFIVRSYTGYIMSIFILAILLRTTNHITRNKKISRDEEER